MTAPSAPVLRVRTDGDKVYCRWQPVEEATDYKLYVDSAPHPTGVEADITYTDIGPSGWFQYVFASAGPTYVRLTALNVLTEESGYSNEEHLDLRGPGRQFGWAAPAGLRAN